MAFAIADIMNRKAQAEKSQAVPKPYGPFRIEVGHSQLEILTNVISELFSGIVWTLTYHSLAPSANATKNPAKAAPIIGFAVVCFACSGWFISQILTGGWPAFSLFPRSRAHHDNVVTPSLCGEAGSCSCGFAAKGGRGRPSLLTVRFFQPGSEDK